MSKHDWIDWNAVVPTATAVVAEGQVITYARFKSDVDQLHVALCQSGGAVGHRVGVVFRHEYWNWVAHLAAAKLGAAVLSLRERDASAVCRAFALDMVLCDADMAGWPEALVIVRQKLNSVDDPIVLNTGGSTLLKTNKRAGAHESTTPIVRLTLTSGTTGRSRSVAWNHAQTLQRVNQVGESLTGGNKTRLYSFQHIGTTGGFRYPLATWRLGGTVYLRGVSVSMQDTWPCLSQCNVLTMAPANLRMVLQNWSEVWPGQSERMLILSGGRVAVPLRDEALLKVGRHMLLAYGSTEAGSAATGDAGLIDRHPGAVGHVRDGVVIEIVDDQDQPLPSSTAGTVRIRTPYMVNTYETLPGQSAEASGHAFRQGWFYPGDQGVLEADGFLSILGRLGDVVNLGGAKLSLPDLEQRMEGMPGVQDFCLLALPLPDGDRLAVVVVPQKDAPSPVMHDWIKKALRRNVPYLLLRTDKIERNEMGKVPRKAFAEKLLPRVIGQMQKQKR
jgi:acyl-CoA synthetase (AMP-forming)/AMP-acid ligase II